MALRAIVAAMQADDRTSQSLTTLLLLALWPGMDAVRGRLLRFFCTRDHELDAELTGRTTIAVRDLDLTRVQRIAATLLRNLERDMRRDLQRRAREVPQSCLSDDGGADLETMFTPPRLSGEHCCKEYAARLSRLLGEDARLVLLVVVAGYSQREAAALLGISHDAARKRYQRALERLRAELRRTCPEPAD
jgi:RNA polymerase sigma-70 factor (ECF subfamily)